MVAIATIATHDNVEPPSRLNRAAWPEGRCENREEVL